MPKSLFVDPAELRSSGEITFENIAVNCYKKSIAESGLTEEALKGIYHDMIVIREFEMLLHCIKTVGRYDGISFSYPGPAHLSIGQEAAAVGQAYCLSSDDFIFGSHRAHAEIIAKALSTIRLLSDESLMKIMEQRPDILKIIQNHQADCKELAVDFFLYGCLSEIFSKKTGFQIGMGGSMHVFFKPFGIYPNNAIVGACAPIAVGAGLYKKCKKQKGIIVANLGDGAFGCGPVWEALNFAAMDQFTVLWEEKGGLPVLFNVLNNSYGMGGQTRGETMSFDMLARVGAGISPSQLYTERIDGYNPLAVIDATQRQKNRLQLGQGPCMLDVITYRTSPHSSSDNGTYRTESEVEKWKELDPCLEFPKQLKKNGIYVDDLLEIRQKIKRIYALAADNNISPYIDFEKNPLTIQNMIYNKQKAKINPSNNVIKPFHEVQRVKKILSGKSISYAECIFWSILEAFYEHDELISYGEDVRDWDGAVYGGLTQALPYSRLFTSPISESVMVGAAVGYAMCGGRALVTFMYADFMGRAGDEIFNQLAKWQTLSASAVKLPVVLRVPVGCKYGAQHSQDWSSLTAQIPGLKVVYPATPYEAKGLMRASLKEENPVIFFESQRLYENSSVQGTEVPMEAYEVEIGSVSKIKEGNDYTIITIGSALYTVLSAVDKLDGISVEILNIHTLIPLDYSEIHKSVKKTGLVLLISDSCDQGSYMHIVSSKISMECFSQLKKAPVVLGAKNWINTPFEYDTVYFPQPEDVVREVQSGYRSIHTATTM